MPRMPKFTFRLPGALLRAAQAKADQHGIPLAEVIRRLLKIWLKG